MTRRKYGQLQPSAEDGYAATIAGHGPVEGIDTGYYILVDVAVLSLAGLLMGLVLGCFFLGIAWRTRNWSGLIAFIVASLVGFAIRGY